jgi:hypothetical protein
MLPFLPIEFFDTFKSQYFFHYQSYKSNKTVKGRFPELIDITILGSENGLVGFEAGDSSIRLENDFWTGMNIRFDSPSEVDRYVSEELSRQINKESVRSNDGSLQKLYDVITDRNKRAEKGLCRICQNFAHLRIFYQTQKNIYY